MQYKTTRRNVNTECIDENLYKENCKTCKQAKTKLVGEAMLSKRAGQPLDVVARWCHFGSILATVASSARLATVASDRSASFRGRRERI